LFFFYKSEWEVEHALLVELGFCIVLSKPELSNLFHFHYNVIKWFFSLVPC